MQPGQPPPVIPRYQDPERIGAGGMGEVYSAYDTILKRRVALKLIRWSQPETVERFVQEARVQARVEHENVCRVYDTGTTTDGRIYIAMQFVRGKTLREIASRLNMDEKV